MNVLDTIRINCPYCRAINVEAQVGVPSKEFNCLSIEEAKKLIVCCGKCHMVFGLDFAGMDIRQVNAQALELADAIRYRSNLLGKTLAISGLYVNVFPGGGILYAITTIIANWRAKRWLRWISWINLFISITWTIMFFYEIHHW